MSGQSDPKGQLIVYAQLAVAFVCVALAVANGFRSPKPFDYTSGMFLVLAMLALVFQQVTRFKGFGIEFEQDFNQLKKAVGELERSVGPGSKSATGSGAEAQVPPPSAAKASPAPVDLSDPNKGQFGGKAERDGRLLTATIRPFAGPASSVCSVVIKVKSTDSERPLTGTVKLHLHPTFGRLSSSEIEPVAGIAKYEVRSFGAFTIGAETDGGQTRLELDLVDVPGGTDSFYLE